MDLNPLAIAQRSKWLHLWRLAPVSSNPDVTVAPTGPLMKNVVELRLWFWGLVPEIDENGLPRFEHLVDARLARHLVEISFSKKQYLWAIPADEVLLSENLTQNPGYFSIKNRIHFNH